MARVVTNEAALRAALLPGVTARSLAAGEAGVEAARRLARVSNVPSGSDGEGHMRDRIKSESEGIGGARVTSKAPHSVFNEYGTVKMSAKPFMRPSMDAARAAL